MFILGLGVFAGLSKEKAISWKILKLKKYQKMIQEGHNTFQYLQPSMSDVIMTPKSFREKPRSNFTLAGNEDIIYNRPSVSESESFNRSNSSVKTTVKFANNDTTAKIAISERSF